MLLNSLGLSGTLLQHKVVGAWILLAIMSLMHLGIFQDSLMVL